MSNPVYSYTGFCPICEQFVRFTSAHEWYRDHLQCPTCPNGSIPRERALMLALRQTIPRWRSSIIHESSPIMRGVSYILSQQVTNYIATQFFPSAELGSMVNGIRNENLEKQTFPDESFDIVISLDVMEHVNKPDQAFKEIARTLRQGGVYIFTTPTYKDRPTSIQRAKYLENGEIEHFAEPEYHGNPVSAHGSLVTYHFGYDLPQIIYQASGMSVKVERFWDPYHGIIGEYTEVYVCIKR